MSPRKVNFTDAKAEVDLLRLDFDHTDFNVDVHSSTRLSLHHKSWSIILNPLDGRRAKNAAGALQGVIARSDGGVADRVDNDAANISVFRYLRQVDSRHFCIQGNYLINIDNHWLSGAAFANVPGQLFDQDDVDKLLLSLKLSDSAQKEIEVLPAWREYQQNRVAGTPNGKFILYMDPAPINIGCFEQYRNKVKTRSLPKFSNEEFVRGGRMIGDDIIEFYAKDDPTSVRVDIWIDQEPGDRTSMQLVYSDVLRIREPSIAIWSLRDPQTFDVTPGIYRASVWLANRGKQKEFTMTDRERFERSELERYEVLLNRVGQK